MKVLILTALLLISSICYSTASSNKIIMPKRDDDEPLEFKRIINVIKNLGNFSLNNWIENKTANSSFHLILLSATKPSSTKTSETIRPPTIESNPEILGTTQSNVILDEKETLGSVKTSTKTNLEGIKYYKFILKR